MGRPFTGGLLTLLLLATIGCSSSDGGAADVPSDSRGAETDSGPAPDVWSPEWVCQLDPAAPPEFSLELGCPTDFEALASKAAVGGFSGTRSLKTVIDLFDDGLYFQNSILYPLHFDFCKTHLSGNGKPPVMDIGTFASTEYSSKYRRFLLGILTHYGAPGVWAYEIEPWDTASPDMVTAAYDLVREASFIGDDLHFHATSELVRKVVPELPDHVKVVSTDELFEGITFLPLNLGEAVGQLRFFDVDELEKETAFVTARDIAVLDRIPNDISVVAGIITDALQTPLSHINVLSQNRGTPNMTLIGAMDDPALRDLENRWVRLTVDSFEYTVEEVTKAEADAWWEAHKPPAVTIPALDLSVTDLRDTLDLTLADIPAFGGKASNYGVLSNIGDPVPVPKAFAVPVFYYKQFEEQNGFDEQLDTLLADEQFNGDIAYREEALGKLQDAMKKAMVDEGFLAMVLDRLETDFPGVRMRFRSSTNAEDLDGFTGAGLYTSKTGDPGDPTKPVKDAIRGVWASLWNLRAYEERAYRSIDHRGISMALLVHRSFPDEDANGVALTNNLFDPLNYAQYINVQLGGISVVKPPPGITADQFLYYFLHPGQTSTFLAHSNLTKEGEDVLTREQTYRLGQALYEIHKTFGKHYAKSEGFYAMDVEFKFNTDPGEEESRLWIKQARPHPGWSSGLE